jgi:hypothetical protein
MEYETVSHFLSIMSTVIENKAHKKSSGAKQAESKYGGENIIAHWEIFVIHTADLILVF